MKGFQKVAYIPHSKSMESAADRRRFIFFAENRNIEFEIYNPLKTYDLVYFSAGADITRYKEIKARGSKVIADCVDSYFADEKSIRGVFRNFAKFITRQNKYLVGNYAKYLKYRFFPNIDAVACGSAEYVLALQQFSDNVHRIPDHCHNEVVRVKTTYKQWDTNLIHIAWKGLGSNIYQLNQLKKVFDQFSLTHDFVLHIVSQRTFYKYMNKYIKIDSLSVVKGLCKNICFHNWDDQTYSSIITKCDFAIIPINESSPTAKNKPENKLINFWKMGMPVIASPIDSYKRVMNESGINLLCSSDSEWLEALKELSNSEVFRESIGERVKKYSGRYYGKAVVLSQWDKLFTSISS